MRIKENLVLKKSCWKGKKSVVMKKEKEEKYEQAVTDFLSECFLLKLMYI